MVTVEELEYGCESPLLPGDPYDPGFHKALSKEEVERVQRALRVHGASEGVALKMGKDTQFEGYVYLEDGQEPNVVKGLPINHWREDADFSKTEIDDQVASLVSSVPTHY